MALKVAFQAPIEHAAADLIQAGCTADGTVAALEFAFSVTLDAMAGALAYDHTQSGWLTLHTTAFGLEPGQPYQVHDLISGSHYLWHGERNYVSLDPHQCPAHVMQLRQHLKREIDFDYFL
jgi:hypothetical protein